ncbi:APC family permease [Sulfurimonas microaerophilic]|uniref:APC family permease n=1 Tax=Sulfurimonas microaerophilic TaxID=3058392 RepID=UPI002714F484|nr:APC family permease [Sulfurimonas sp. hsl 1-7]
MRSIGVLGAISIGIGGMVGGGIFAVLGEAVSLAHSATMLAFLFAGIVALLTAYSYAKLSVYFQSEGGTVSFIDNSFGHNLLSGSTNLMLWFSYLITISLYAVAFGSYGETFFSHHSEYLRHILISTAIILPALINLVSGSFVSKSETMIVGIKIALLVLIIISGIPYIETSRLDITPEITSSANLMEIAVSGMIIFVAYEGFELIANAAKEIKDPKKNLPRAFYSSVLLVIVLYVLIAIISVGTVPEAKLLEAKDYALAIAAKPALGHVGFTLVAIAALLATFSAINATIYGNARLSYIVAMDGELPNFFTKEKNEIPFMGVIAILGLSLFLANTIDLGEIAIIGSASFLLIFFIVNLSAYRVRDKIGANRYILLGSIIFTFLALCVLLFHTYESDVRSFVIFVIFILTSIVFEYFYGKFVRGHIFHRKY